MRSTPAAPAGSPAPHCKPSSPSHFLRGRIVLSSPSGERRLVRRHANVSSPVGWEDIKSVMTTFIIIIVAILAASAVITYVGTRLIERAHRPRGRFIDVGGFPQHVVEMGQPDAQVALPV